MKGGIMKIAFIFFLFLIFSSWVTAQTEARESEFNFGFEKRNKQGKLPDNWFRLGGDFPISIDTLEVHSGKNALRIESTADVTSKSFGSAACRIPADYAGKEIELRGYLKLEKVGEESFAGLALRIDGSGGTLQFDNMSKQKLKGSADWKLYSIKLPFPENAEEIFVGAILAGTGKVWVDDFELLIDGKPIEVAEKRVRKEYKATLDREFDRGSKI